MDEILWGLAWSAALRPELPMIPDRSVFLCASPGRSLTATVEGAPSLLHSPTDFCIERLLEPTGHKDAASTTAHDSVQQNGEDRNSSHSSWLDMLAASDAPDQF